MRLLMTVLLLGLFAQSRPDPYVNVTTYGADPTGVKDSLAAVESAMAAACATKPGGAIVWFPAGKYTMSAPIPETSAHWCNGLTLLGSGIRATQLDFSGGSGYAINYPERLRDVTTKGFLIQITNNDFLGGVFLGGGNFSDTFQDIYIVAPETSTAKGFSTYEHGTGHGRAVDSGQLPHRRIRRLGGRGVLARTADCRESAALQPLLCERVLYRLLCQWVVSGIPEQRRRRQQLAPGILYREQWHDHSECG